MKTLFSKKAFTMLEVMIVIVLISIALGFSVLFYQTSQVRADVNAQAANLVSYLRLAQSSAMSGEGYESHGIHLEDDSYILFEGKPYNPIDTSNFTIQLPGTITIQNITLNGGGQDIIFDAPQGETQTYGTFELYSSQIQKTVSITISQIGTVRY